MQIPIDEQIAEVKNNIRYFCQKYKWENYGTSKHHKHYHHSKHKKHFIKNELVDEDQYNFHKQSQQLKKPKKEHKNSNDEKKIVEKSTAIKNNYYQQKEEIIENNPINTELNQNNEHLKIQEENQNHQIVSKKDNENIYDFIANKDISENMNPSNQICLFSSDDNSDSSFDFKEFHKYFKLQDDLYHLTKRSKHRNGETKKKKAIILYSDSDSDSYYYDSSFDSISCEFKKDPEFKKRKQKINDYLAPTQTKNQATNTSEKEYSSINTQTISTSKRNTQNHAKINFNSQLKSNSRQNLHSYSNSSSNSGSTSNNYSSSRNSDGSSKKQLISVKTISEQYASSENESSKGSNKAKKVDIKKNSSFSSKRSSQSSQASIGSNGSRKNSIKIENQMILIEEEEEEIENIDEKKSNGNCANQMPSKNSSSSYRKDIKSNEIIQGQIQNKSKEKGTNSSNEEDNLGEEEILERISQSAKLIIQNKSGISQNTSGFINNKQDEDIDKLIEEISQNSSKIKPNIKKNRNLKKLPATLKSSSTENDENTEAYSQIPSEFSDNIGVDSALEEKKSQPTEEVVQTEARPKVLKLEDFMEESGSIPVSSKLENENDGNNNNNYLRYGSSGDSPIDNISQNANQ